MKTRRIFVNCIMSFKPISIWLLLSLLACARVANAQNYKLFIAENPLEVKCPERIDSAQLDGFLERYKNRYLALGYAASNVDSVIWGKGRVDVIFYTGLRYRIGQIQMKNDSGLNQLEYFQNRFGGNVFDSNSNFRIAEEALNYLENNGYPFAKVNIRTLVSNENVNLDVNIYCGPQFRFDTMHMEGDKVLSSNFIQAYTGIKTGKPYSETLLRKAQEKLNQLPYLTSERPPQMVFISGGKAKPYFYLRKKKSDQVNGIIGLAPGSNSPNSSNRNLVLTGEFLLRLNNMFKSGKMLYVNVRSFKARSREVIAEFNYPYVLGKPLGLDLALNSTKYDTLYAIFKKQIGVQYYTSGINGFKFFYQSSQTNLITVDTSSVRANKQFPAINSIQLNLYGISGTFNFLDYRFNPLKGLSLDFTLTTGVKTIVRDNQISEVRFGSPSYNLYDSTQLKTNQFQYHLKLDKFIPLSRKSTVRLGAYVSQISAPKIFFNELMREGGINSLRGFNEQSIFASNFNMLEVEYRFLFSTNSHFKLFWNGAYYEDKSFGHAKDIYDWPWGLGAGANIETGNYILSLMYALGKQKGNNFDLRTGKVHFGITNYF